MTDGKRLFSRFEEWIEREHKRNIAIRRLFDRMQEEFEANRSDSAAHTDSPTPPHKPLDTTY